MQQNKATVQTTRELQEVRRFPISADTTHIFDVEKKLVKKYLGIPYQHRGRTEEGLDCWGLLKCVYSDMGVKLFDVEDLKYSKVWGLSGNDYFKEHYTHDWEKVKRCQIFDAVLFVNSRGVANHAGIVLSNRRFIHCCRQGVVISRLSDASWKGNIEGFYRLKK